MNSKMTLLEQLAVRLATCFGIGNAPVAPGTLGSIPGVFLGLSIAKVTGRLWPEPSVQFSAVTLFLILGSLLAFWCIHVTERVFNTHDESRIVADEVIGQAIAIAYITPSVKGALLGFGLFRLFDITKPLLIGWIDESAPGAIGTLGDDLLAGVVTALILGGIVIFFPTLLV